MPGSASDAARQRAARARRVSSEGSGVSLEELLADPDNPFLATDTPMTAYEWAKLVLMLPVVLGRAILVAILLPPTWAYMALLTIRLPLNQPLPRWRAALLLPVLRFMGRVLLLLGFFMWPRLRGAENLAEAKRLRAVMIFNHASYLDALLIGILFTPCGLAKAGVARIPFFGSVAKAFQFLFVQRTGTTDPAVGDAGGRAGSTQTIHERAADARYPLFAMGPEGTTKHTGYLLEFSTGAFVGGRPVVPVILRYRCRHFDVGWGVVQNVYWHFLRVQTQLVNACEVEVLPPYIPSPEERADPRLYADNVRALMAARLGARLSRYGIPEQQMIKRARVCVDWSGRRLVRREADGSCRPFDPAQLRKQA